MRGVSGAMVVQYFERTGSVWLGDRLMTKEPQGSVEVKTPLWGDNVMKINGSVVPGPWRLLWHREDGYVQEFRGGYLANLRLLEA